MKTFKEQVSVDDEKYNNHSGSKYMKKPISYGNGLQDIYCTLLTWNITCPAMQHALKKGLMSGKRGKGGSLQDKREMIDAIKQSIELEELGL